MKIVIVGCGRVGSTLAESLDAVGHDVIVIDTANQAFDRLPDSFRGNAIRADGTDEDALRRAGAANADVFIALTEGDNRNVMAAQVAAENLGIPRVLAKINDPVRAEAYAHLGVATLCRTNLMVDAVGQHFGLDVPIRPGIGLPPVGAPAHGPDGQHVTTGLHASPSASTAERPTRED